MGDLGAAGWAERLGTVADRLDAIVAAALNEVTRVDAALAEAEVAMRHWVELNGAES